MNPPKQRRPSRFGPALWLLALGFLLAGIAVAMHLLPMLRASRESGAVGDGASVSSYGFDLEPCLIPANEIVATGLAKGALPAMTHPPVLMPGEADSIGGAERGKYMVSGDRVVGVVIGGAARAYPLHVLAWHEVVNDTLGGEPIAVTYSPLSGGVIVFGRRVGDEVFRFGVSGLLYNSNLLMYDMGPGGAGESLWSQMMGVAVAGPRAGIGIEVLPSAVMAWGDWRARHPKTTVLGRDPRRVKAYKKDPYGNYFSSDLLRFPVSPMPPEGGAPLKSRVLAVRPGRDWVMFRFDEIGANADGKGEWRTAAPGGTPLVLHYRKEPETAWALAGDPPTPVPSYQCFWFAWYAFRGE
ncbi:MAG: DUF3179 domain-containing (seleno)protein [Candidatus Eisenbacteria bacterium]